MNAPKISYDDFVLPFLTTGQDSTEEREEEEDVADNDIESFDSRVPANAIFIGLIENEIANFTSWKVEDHYYVLPWEGSDFDWAMFRISWDDNWERYEWCADARIKGAANQQEAARLMAEGLFEKWGIDLKKTECQMYRVFLAEI